MRFIVLPLLLAACAPGADGLGFSPSPDDMSAFLVDQPDIAFAERTRVLGPTRATLLPGGEPLYGDPWKISAPREYTVVDAAEQLGVLVDQRDWHLVVWLDREDLATVPVVATWVGGVRIPAGTTLETVDHRPGESLVSVRNHSLEVETWAADARLDQFWYSDDSPEPWEPDTRGEYVRILQDVALLDAPLGEPFAWVLPREEALVSLSGFVVDEARGHVRVQFDADGWPVDAWLHEDDIARGSFGLFGYGSASCGGVGCGWGRLPNIRADAPLYAEPAGAVVGRTTTNTYLELDGEPGDWRGAELSTEFGTAAVWVDPADLI